MSLKQNKITKREKFLKNRHDCSLDNYTCLTCDHAFSSIKTLYFHMFSIHAEERVYYSCPVCSITFVQQWSVCRHLMRVHKKSKEEAITLKTSIKTTSSTNSYKEHSQKRINPDLELQIADCKTATCRYCFKAFSTPANLRRHVARHLGLARYWCSLCDHKTFDRSECQEHIKRVHCIDETDQFITSKE